MFRWTGNITLGQGGHGGCSLLFVYINKNWVGSEGDTGQVGDFGGLSGGEKKCLSLCILN